MIHLPETIKNMLNALAMQDASDFLSESEKKANLKRVLAEIENERSQQPAKPSHILSGSELPSVA